MADRWRRGRDQRGSGAFKKKNEGMRERGGAGEREREGEEKMRVFVIL
jgi:hypothetical protein